MKLATQISLGFFIAISIDLVDSYVNYSLTQKVNTNTDFLTNSEVVIRTSSNLNRDLVDMQNALRGYLLSGDRRFLIRYDSGLSTIPELIKQERLLIEPSSLQISRLDSISMIHNIWLGYANQIIDAKSKAIADPALNWRYEKLFKSQFTLNAGKNYNERIAAIFRSFDQHEYDNRQKRRAALAASIKATDRFSLFFSLLLVIVGSALAFYLVRKIARRIDSMVKLAEKISTGDFATVNDDQTDELTSLSHSLNLMSQKLSWNIDELEKRNDELNQFAYVVSHDLKAPIRGISNVVQWIKEDIQDEISPAMEKYLDIIPERLKRMADLINGLLDYARIGRSKFPKEEVDVSVLVKELADVIVPKEYYFTIGDLPVLFTEKILLEQVFSNLLSNAVKYTSTDDGHIRVSCTEQAGVYEFEVSDNGIGIEEQYHGKIFEMFQTLREKHDEESTGIGLAIVKKIIDENGGTIRVLSSLDKGAKFLFTWPKNET
ncbi:MAG: CHASE3 domain-containing protein [Bacteroidetes bacterium]|jgi:signal transduction histidine kinase|nr:CHASE3 domain-containing protein [Bacteroidota bacterium]